MHKKYAKDGLAAISVSLDQLSEDPQTKDKVLKFLRSKEATFTNLLMDEPLDLWGQKLRFNAPPCYYVFSRQGKWTMFQPDDDEFDFHGTIEKLIVELLREK